MLKLLLNIFNKKKNEEKDFLPLIFLWARAFDQEISIKTQNPLNADTASSF